MGDLARLAKAWAWVTVVSRALLCVALVALVGAVLFGGPGSVSINWNFGG